MNQHNKKNMIQGLNPYLNHWLRERLESGLVRIEGEIVLSSAIHLLVECNGEVLQTHYNLGTKIHGIIVELVIDKEDADSKAKEVIDELFGDDVISIERGNMIPIELREPFKQNRVVHLYTVKVREKYPITYQDRNYMWRSISN